MEKVPLAGCVKQLWCFVGLRYNGNVLYLCGPGRLVEIFHLVLSVAVGFLGMVGVWCVVTEVIDV